MIVTYVGMFLAVVLGFALAGPLGAAVGAILGMAMGMMLSGVVEATRKARAGAEVVREERRLLCVPKGQVATATFVREAGTRRWLDVERCTLCEPEEKVGCQKRCLLLMRDTLGTRRAPVAVDATT
jgi:hypothetical protein